MTIGIGEEHAGLMLRQWRERRRLTQLDLALDARVSTRHLSYVESGRSRPGRDILVRLLAALDVPLREQNRILLNAGHAPAFPDRRLDDPEMRAVRDALQMILDRHEPYPAVAFDHRWTLVAANPALTRLSAVLPIAPGLTKPPINVARLGLHPHGLGPLIANYDAWRGQVVDRLRRQLDTTHDPALAALIEEVRGYPVPAGDGAPSDSSTAVLGPLKLRLPSGARLAFVGLLASFDTPFDVTTSELAIELLYPADEVTRAALSRFQPVSTSRMSGG